MKQLLLVFVIACGGSHKSAPAPAPMATEEHEGMPAELKAFHDVLAPKWHAPEGPNRIADACAAAGQFASTADALAHAAAPAKANPQAWKEGSEALVRAVGNFKTQCGSGTPSPGAAGEFQGVHEAFHHLLEQVGGEQHHEEPATPPPAPAAY